MNKVLLLLGVLVCLMAVHARHFTDRSADEGSDDQETLRPKDHTARHRRRRWQSNYGYDYSPPSFYYPQRDERNNQEVIQHIYRLLEDISVYIRRTAPPPQPPQPIYIPYPVAFPTRVACKTPQNSTNTKLPVPDKRINSMVDANQNWGIVPQVEDYSDDENDGARPISFEPLVPKQLVVRPAPKVDHGSQQGPYSTEAPKFADRPTPQALSLSSQSRTSVPGMCNAAILSCCGFSGDKAQQRQCFYNVGCESSYSDVNICTSESIENALTSFRNAYSPIQ